MAIRPDIVDVDVMEDQIYVLPEESWMPGSFFFNTYIAMYLKDSYFSFQKGKLKFYYLRNLKRKIPSGFNRCLQYLNSCSYYLILLLIGFIGPR